jgi:hypothetical protein
MQQTSPDSSLSLSQRAYVIVKSLRGDSRWLLKLVIGILFFNILSIIAWFNTASITRENLVPVSILISIAISAYVVGWFVIKAPHAYRKLQEWDEDYLESAYILIFDTTIPKGNSTAEKVFYLARLVFPELRSDLYISALDKPSFPSFVKALLPKKKIVKNTIHGNISQSLNYAGDSYFLDVAYKTDEGYFIVKDFKDKVVSPEDLRKLARIVKEKFTHIFRVISVAKAYDESFLNRETLESQMTKELKASFKIDLILEENVGLSVLWVGR